MHVPESTPTDIPTPTPTDTDTFTDIPTDTESPIIRFLKLVDSSLNANYCWCSKSCI
jgi:hypothetical protein